MSNNIVVFTNLNDGWPLAYGVGLEVLYKLQNDQPKKNYALLILGERDAHKAEKFTTFLNKVIGLEKEKIFLFFPEKEIDENLKISLKDFSECAALGLKSSNEIDSIEYNGYKVGIPVLSSLITKHKCSRVNFDKIREEVKSYIYYSLVFNEAFTCAARKFKLGKSDNYYIFNGRFYDVYPIAENIKTENLFYFDGFGAGFPRYAIYNYRLHRFDKIAVDMKRFWDESRDNYNKKVELAKEFFEENKKSQFTSLFKESLQVDKKNKKVITFFVSSEDEFASLHPSINIHRFFKSQKEALYFIADHVAQRDDYLLLIRVHPHYEKKCFTDREFWNNLSFKNSITIPSGSPINSYDIIQKSSIVVSYLSTTGIESTYLEKPSVVLSNVLYSGIDAVYEPKSKLELLSLLDSLPPPKNKENCYPYGYFQKVFGHNFNLLEILNLTSFSDLHRKVFNYCASCS